MEFDDPELLAEFVTESREHLADVEGQLLDIEASGANGAEVSLCRRGSESPAEQRSPGGSMVSMISFERPSESTTQLRERAA